MKYLKLFVYFILTWRHLNGVMEYPKGRLFITEDSTSQEMKKEFKTSSEVENYKAILKKDIANVDFRIEEK